MRISAAPRIRRLFFFLHEEHGSQVLSLPFSRQRNTRVSSKGSFAASLGFAESCAWSAPRRHDGGLHQRFSPRVTADCNPVFRNGQPNLRCITFCRSVQFSNLHGKNSLCLRCSRYPVPASPVFFVWPAASRIACRAFCPWLPTNSTVPSTTICGVYGLPFPSTPE